ARALLGSEQTITRRITRAKQAIKDSGVPFALPASGELEGRLANVLRVLYLIFNEGYASTAGTALTRADLSQEAIRLARVLHAARPDDGEAAGLLALMLLVHARHRARTAPDGSLVPMADQDRGRWDRDAIGEGVALVTAALPRGPVGPYQLQAAIAAVHDEAPSAASTDWRQIAALYGVLLRLDDNPVVALNHAVAVSMVAGPRAGLELVQRLSADTRINADRRFHAVRGHLLEMAGDRGAALAAYQAAAMAATNLQQQRYLNQQVTRLQDPPGTADLRIDRDVLQVQVITDAFASAFTPEAGLLDTAERRSGVGDQGPVDADHAEVQPLGRAQGALHICRVEVGDQAVLRR